MAEHSSSAALFRKPGIVLGTYIVWLQPENVPVGIDIGEWVVGQILDPRLIRLRHIIVSPP